jgi:hypothetical protein
MLMDQKATLSIMLLSGGYIKTVPCNVTESSTTRRVRQELRASSLSRNGFRFVVTIMLNRFLSSTQTLPRCSLLSECYNL